VCFDWVDQVKGKGTMTMFTHNADWEEVRAKQGRADKKLIMIFFLEYAGELHIIASLITSLYAC
jgi:hypothetical protein